MPRVLLLQRVLPHYRISFVEALAETLRGAGIELELTYGQEYPGEVPRSVELSRPWARRIRNRYLGMNGRRVVWQPCLEQLRTADLIIIEQSNGLLVNYPLLFGWLRGNARLAYWGHGRNRQSTAPGGLSERLKRSLLGAVDWWFAYTQATAAEVLASGFPGDRLTVVNNSIDGGDFAPGTAVKQLPAVHAALLERLRSCAHVCIYCGGMYREKRLDFLLAALESARVRLPDLQAVFIGSGPSESLVAEAAERSPWIHYLGALTGAARAPWLQASRALLMPGPVGLAVMDSFLAMTPVVTTDIRTHGPEIAYLQHGENGLIAPDTLAGFVDAVVDALSCAALQERLARGCARSAQLYTLDAMVERFAQGIRACLASK